MSEPTLPFSNSTELKRWLETQTAKVLAPVQAQAKKLKEEVTLALIAVEENSKFLFDLSTKEIEKRNMKTYNRARALNKLSRLFVDRFKKIIAPEQVSYDTINHYAQETQKVLFVTDIDIKNWFPRISPFFIMDRRRFLAIYQRAQQAYTTLNEFVTKDYVKIKMLEETLQLVNELQTTENHLTSIGMEKEQTKNERLPLEQEIADLETKIAELKTKGPVDKLNLVNTEIETLTNELRNEIRHLQKPFVKMQALATMGGGGGVTPDELVKINQYLDAPFDALVFEADGYPQLKEVLQKLETLMEKDTLKLKPEKQRKAEQTVDEVLRHDSLAKLQIRCKEMATNRDQLLASTKMDEIKACITTYERQVEQLKVRKTSIETHETVKGNAYKETVDKIANLKHTIERNVLSSIAKRIQIA